MFIQDSLTQKVKKVNFAWLDVVSADKSIMLEPYDINDILYKYADIATKTVAMVRRFFGSDCEAQTVCKYGQRQKEMPVMSPTLIEPP